VWRQSAGFQETASHQHTPVADIPETRSFRRALLSIRTVSLSTSFLSFKNLVKEIDFDEFLKA
ncbi:hypothetical protein TNCV_1951521, partial [Trichonephila clavipes]